MNKRVNDNQLFNNQGTFMQNEMLKLVKKMVNLTLKAAPPVNDPCVCCIRFPVKCCTMVLHQTNGYKGPISGVPLVSAFRKHH